jgi:hypothetical protein
MKFGVKKMSSASSSPSHKVDTFNRKQPQRSSDPLAFDESVLQQKVIEEQLRNQIEGMRQSASKKTSRDIPDS